MLYSTGSNSHGQLGHGDAEDTSIFHAASLPSGAGRPRQLVFGGTHTLALSSKGLYVAGSNARGQLGPTTALASQGTGAETTTTHFKEWPLEQLVMALEEAGGDGKHKWEVVGVAAAWETSFVQLRAAGGVVYDELLVFGANDWDEWASAEVKGADGSKKAVVRITFDHLAEKDEVVQIKQLKAGPRHVVALLELASPTIKSARRIIVGWGAARHGQLDVKKGAKPPRTISTPSLIGAFINHSGETTVYDFALGRDHTGALAPHSFPSSAPFFMLLGSSKHGQLGTPPLFHNPSTHPYSHAHTLLLFHPNGSAYTPDTKTHFSSSWSSSCLAFDTLSTLVTWGLNSHGQLGRPPSSLVRRLGQCFRIESWQSNPHAQKRIAKLSSGSEHVLLLTEGGEVWTWGWNEHGNLGDGSSEDGSEPKVVWDAEGALHGEARGRVREVWGGNATSWVWVDNDEDMGEESAA